MSDFLMDELDDEENYGLEIEDAIEGVANAVVSMWEQFGADADASVVTLVDGVAVRITVSVELVD